MASEQKTKLIMPSMGEGITEATLVKWLKNSGDKVEADEPLLEVSTDKVDTEIPSPHSGFIHQLLVAEGADVSVGSTIALLGDEPPTARPSGTEGLSEKDAITEVPPASTSHPASDSHQLKESTSTPVHGYGAGASGKSAGEDNRGTKVNESTGERSKPRSSPIVRKMAKHHGIRLEDLTGTGLNGRLTKRDVESYLADLPIQGTLPGPSSPGPTAGQSGQPANDLGRVATEGGDGSTETLDGVTVRREPMSRIRRLTAEHMVRSVQTSPHVTTVFEMNLSKMVGLRGRSRGQFERQHGFKLTYTPMFLHSTVQAIKAHPAVNVSVDGNDILWKDAINIGCAVAIPSGLIVPVIKGAENLNLTGIAKALHNLVAQARSKSLKPSDVQGGTFSVTNPGMFGSVVSTPIINQPQVAILSIGAIVEKPVIIDGMIAVQPTCQIGLTFDHRVIDGEGGARFLATLKKIIESYDSLA